MYSNQSTPNSINLEKVTNFPLPTISNNTLHDVDEEEGENIQNE